MYSCVATVLEVLHCLLQIFDAGIRTMLRQLKAHKRAAHVAHFSPDRMHVLSAADDTTVCVLLLYFLALLIEEYRTCGFTDSGT